jgi:7,8-dihydropterin-6-yl-methyl-4-(beta-D-ribofuranosyl)aminobenzene 5'-phosphate synthase
MKKRFMRYGLAALAVIVNVSILSSCANPWGVREAERIWQEYRPPKIQDVGSTKSLQVLPLIDWYTSSPDLIGEPGVSYLIRTDHSTILFDTGFNQDETDPSPLQHNMQVLGITMADFDTIVISHNHPDHVGGFGWQDLETFSLGNEQIDLSGKRAFTPIPMTYPGLSPVHSKDPTVIAPGVATIGTIPRQLFLAGWVEEQALAIHVEGKGIVIIVGCGHPTLTKILQRTEQVFSGPVYGVIGGLHYPVPDGRLTMYGLDIQPLVSTESLFYPITMEDVMAEINTLRERKPGIVSLSAHDSSDEAIEQFRQAFGSAYRDLRVGEVIVIGEENGPIGKVDVPK